MSDYGTVLEPGTIRFERLLPASPEKVWAYLVEDEKRALWLAGGEWELSAGGEVLLTFKNDTLSDQNEQVPDKYANMPDVVHMTGEVIAVDPPRYIQFSWNEPDHGLGAPVISEVTFELAAKDGGTLLVLTHRKLPEGEVMKGIAAGWHTHLDILVHRIAGQPLKPFWATHMGFEDEYHVRLGL